MSLPPPPPPPPPLLLLLLLLLLLRNYTCRSQSAQELMYRPDSCPPYVEPLVVLAPA